MPGCYPKTPLDAYLFEINTVIFKFPVLGSVCVTNTRRGHCLLWVKKKQVNAHGG
jgi:hypothetical protein